MAAALWRVIATRRARLGISVGGRGALRDRVEQIMTGQSPEIHAVVEVSIDETGIWVDLPPKPWPTFVRLSAATTKDEVALLLGTLSSYGRWEDDPAQSADE